MSDKYLVTYFARALLCLLMILRFCNTGSILFTVRLKRSSEGGTRLLREKLSCTGVGSGPILVAKDDLVFSLFFVFYQEAAWPLHFLAANMVLKMLV